MKVVFFSMNDKKESHFQNIFTPNNHIIGIIRPKNYYENEN